MTVTVATPMQIGGPTIPIANIQMLTLQIIDAKQEPARILCPTCTVQIPLGEIKNSLQGINETVSVQIFKAGMRIIDIPNIVPKEMPAMKAVPASQISNRNLLTEGPGYILRVVGARGQTLAETAVSLKFR